MTFGRNVETFAERMDSYLTSVAAAMWTCVCVCVGKVFCWNIKSESGWGSEERNDKRHSEHGIVLENGFRNYLSMQINVSQFISWFSLDFRSHSSTHSTLVWWKRERKSARVAPLRALDKCLSIFLSLENPLKCINSWSNTLRQTACQTSLSLRVCVSFPSVPFACIFVGNEEKVFDWLAKNGFDTIESIFKETRVLDFIIRWMTD